MEDNLKKTAYKNKMEEKPINQNQPNWLWHHCKFTWLKFKIIFHLEDLLFGEILNFDLITSA